MDLTAIPTVELERCVAAIERRRLEFPLSAFSLEAEGLSSLARLKLELNEAGAAAALAACRAVIAERRRRTPPQLVWTGPEARSSAARDTAVVLSDLLQRAQTRVLIAGFAFDHAEAVLRPLHDALSRGVTARVFADQATVSGFLDEHWPFGPPFPELFGFVPAPGVFASLHAKCVVVDGRWVLATSANFTDRGQSRNVEVGLLVDDAAVAAALEAQFVAGPWFSPLLK